MPGPRYPLRIVTGEDQPCEQRLLQAALTRLGHSVVGIAPCGLTLIELCKSLNPDLVVLDLKLPRVEGLDGAADLCGVHPVPIIIVSEHHEADLVERAGDCPNVMGYVIKPATEANLGPAVAVALRRFAQLRKLIEEAASLRLGMEERKLVEKAKGAVMKRLNLDEDEAFRRLRKLANDTNRKLVDVAGSVLQAEAVFHVLDGTTDRPVWTNGFRGSRSHR